MTYEDGIKKEIQRLKREAARRRERAMRESKIESETWTAEKESWRTTPMTKEVAEFNELARRALHPEGEK